jgi:hypothetical protein
MSIKLELVVWSNDTIEGAKNEQVQMEVGFCLTNNIAGSL